MNIPRAILNILKCGVCGAQLSRGPVYQQHDGTVLCTQCFTPDIKATRNIHYEALAKCYVFPCKYNYLGCDDTVSFVQAGEAIPHEEVCEHRQWVCPVLGSTHCDWLGPRADLLKHCEDLHPDLVLKNPCTLQLDIVRPNEKIYILRAFEVRFLLHVKVDVTSGRIYYLVRYLGQSKKAKNFFYDVEVKRNDESILKEGVVVSQSCQEDTALTIDINGLVSVLGGFDSVLFTLEMKQRETEEECEWCDTQGTELTYWDFQRGWLCENCGPDREVCDNQGCSHRDILIKCAIHEVLFCLQRTECFICEKDVERGSLDAHRSSECLTVSKAGSSWRVTQGRRQLFMVSGAAGIAVCEGALDEDGFELTVHVPVTSKRLREFGCVVRVTQPSTGQVCMYKPDVVYYQPWDWEIKVEKTEFSSWDCVFDVSVVIRKIMD